MKRISAGVMIIGVLFLASCDQQVANAPADQAGTSSSLQSNAGLLKLMTMSAYYDAELFTIGVHEYTGHAAEVLLAHNKSINTIYEMDEGLPGGEPFIPVLDAIQGDGFNPIWQEVEITFNAGFTPHQFFDDESILDAAGGTDPEITLDITTDVFLCPVIGQH